MIRKLKRKFTILATVSMLVLMTVLLVIMNVVNYTSVVTECDLILDVLSQFQWQSQAQPNVPLGSGNTAPDTPGNFPFINIPHGMSPEVPYESRYFTVMVDENGTVKESDLSKIITVDSDSVQTYIQQAIDSASDRGFIGQFRFAKQSDNVVTRIMFLDCGRKLDSFTSFFWTSTLVGLFGCLVVFVAFLLVSGRIVKPIADSYEKQKQFISNAGHEIKTPLTIINANVDLMECDGEKEELTEIRTQTRRLTQLTNALVSLTKMEEADITLQKIAMPFSDIAAETANSFAGVAAANDATYTIDIQPSVSLCGAPDQMRQLLSIVLENAVKYVPTGGNLSFTLTAGKKTAKICVINTTKEAVNPTDLPRVFDRFYRTDASRNSATGGHGLGLSIAKSIVEAHGGKISATTQTGMDFCIAVELPL